jgi:hypothetical protein
VHLQYPPFSSSCALDLFRLARGGFPAIKAELPLAAKCIWTLIGAGLGMTVGEPEEIFGALPEGEEEASVEQMTQLQGALQGLVDDGHPESFGQAEGEIEAEAIDPLTLMLITEGLKLALKAVQKWLDKRKN